MEEMAELIETCSKGSKMNWSESFLYESTKNRVYWSMSKRSMTSILFTR